MIFRRCLVLLVCLYSANGQDVCVNYTFEDGFYNLFNDYAGLACLAVRQFWDERRYEDIGLDPPNLLSTTYISPMPILSCVSSFEFNLSAQGVIEFTVYMSGSSSIDQLTVLASQIILSGNDNTVGNMVLQPSSPNFVTGWSTHRMTLIGSGTFRGYVRLIYITYLIILSLPFRYLLL